ncbi:MAG: hypothetical protein ACD_33C00015G0004 [uncultured bacterium]|nr:MAG: hypothetical protein ACD_33C00015G0004 [uncultured bacterium]
MSNVLIYSVNEIKSQIPYEMLAAGFTIDEQPTTVNLTSLDNKILMKCIRARVMMDANIVGGIETVIPLMGIMPSFIEAFYAIYNIPPELTMNKEIISVLGITNMAGKGYFGPSGINQSGAGMGGFGNSNAIMNVADRIGNSASDMSILTNTHLELVAYNTVLVYANYRSIANYGLRVVLENDNNMNNISPRSYKSFSMLCVLACKAYIYNKLIIKINSGYLASGQELGMFKTMLDSYESAEEDYRVYLREVWQATAFANDTTRFNRYIKSMLQPDL